MSVFPKMAALGLACTSAFSAVNAEAIPYDPSCGAANDFAYRVRADLVVNMDTGSIYEENNAAKQLTLASLTKMVSVYVMKREVEEKGLDPTTPIPLMFAPYKGFSDPVTAPYKSITIDEALKGGATRSLNDALYSLAVFLEGNEQGIVNKMNATAAEIGMSRTHFVNVTGYRSAAADKDHRSTLADISLFLTHMAQRTDLSLFTMPRVSIKGRWQKNTDALLQDAALKDDILFSKTGFTCTFGRGLALIVKEEDQRLIILTAGHNTMNDRYAKARELIALGKARALEEKTNPKPEYLVRKLTQFLGIQKATIAAPLSTLFGTKALPVTKAEPTLEPHPKAPEQPPEKSPWEMPLALINLVTSLRRDDSAPQYS